MTSQEFQRLQTAAKLKNADIQSRFQVSDQTVINWRKGYTRIPAAVQILIRQWAEQVKAPA